MVMTAEQWQAHKLHRDAVIADTGRWIGLADENGEPLFDCPPGIDATAPRTRGAITSGRWQFPCRAPGGVVHPIVDELVAEGLSRVDRVGQLVPVMGKTRWLIVERQGAKRRAYRLTHTSGHGDGDAPSVIEAHGEDLLSLLNRVPAFSAPTSITGRFTEFKRDWIGDEETEIFYAKPRDLQDMKMLTVADGATIDGPAEDVIRRIIDTSLETAFKATGKTRSILVNPAESGLESPYLALTVEDGYLWDTLGAVALQAGVGVSVDWWWPGDEPVEGLDLSGPRMIVTVAQRQEVPRG